MGGLKINAQSYENFIYLYKYNDNFPEFINKFTYLFRIKFYALPSYSGIQFFQGNGANHNYYTGLGLNNPNNISFTFKHSNDGWGTQIYNTNGINLYKYNDYEVSFDNGKCYMFINGIKGNEINFGDTTLQIFKYLPMFIGNCTNDHPDTNASYFYIKRFTMLNTVLHDKNYSYDVFKYIDSKIIYKNINFQ